MGKSEIASQLIEKEKPFQCDKHPDVWFCAVGSGSKECVEVLLKAGLSIDKPAQGTWRDHPNWVWSVAKDYLVKGLCLPLDETDYFNDIFNRTALSYAKDNEDEEMIDYLEPIKKLRTGLKV